VSSVLLALPVHRAALPSIMVCSVLFFLGQTAVYTLLPRMHKIYDQDSSEAINFINWDLLERMPLLSFAFYTFVTRVSCPKHLRAGSRDHYISCRGSNAVARSHQPSK
jgi:hypothetical protein